MKKLTQIKKDLRSGDQKLVADALGFTQDYINKVLKEERNSEKVLTALSEVIENRKKLFKRLKSFNYKTQK